MNRLHRYHIDDHAVLTKAEEQALARRIQRGWCERVAGGRRLNRLTRDAKRALDKLILCNQKLVVTIARRYQGHGLVLADLIAEGQQGLMRAAVKFDPERGLKFSTYAVRWIRQGIQRALHYHHIIRIPVYLPRERWPTYSVRSLREGLGRDADLETLKVLPGDLERLELYERALAHLRRLYSKRDVSIVLERMSGGKLWEIGERHGMSRERVRQIVRKAVGELRCLMNPERAKP